jgi:hypothetical protein
MRNLKQEYTLATNYRHLLTVANVMKLAFSTLILAILVLALGTPKPTVDVATKPIPLLEERAYAMSAPKPATKPAPVKAAATPAVTPAPATAAPTPPTCADDEWVWADDGQCHKKPVAAAPVAQAAPAAAAAPAWDGSCGDNSYANYIYSHESGCNPSAINSSSGACGIGQELPCGKSGCSLGNYACQNAYFTNYAISRYGSWAGAYQFWVAHKWW